MSIRQAEQSLTGHIIAKGEAGKTAYEYALAGGFTGTEEEFAILLANQGGVKSVNGAKPDENGNIEIDIPEGFSGSWNDLEDKPFGEEMVGAVDFEWDGNLSGFEVYDVSLPNDDEEPFIKISDIVPINVDLQTISGIKCDADGLHEFSRPLSDFDIQDGYISYHDRFATNGGTHFGDAYIYIVTTEEGAAASGFPSTGIYVAFDDEYEGIAGYYFKEIHLSAFEGTIKIPEKYIPKGFAGSWNNLEDKPFYEESTSIEGLEYIVCREIIHTGTEFSHDFIIPLEVGQTYNVYNGDTTLIGTCEVKVGADGICYLGTEDFSEYPFYITPTITHLSYAWVQAVRPVIVKIVGVSGVISGESKIHYLDPKYIKGMYYTSDPVETPIVEETTVTIEEGAAEPVGLLTATQPLEVGQEYVVTLDGTVYNCICKMSEEFVMPYIGNGGGLEFGEDTGELFFIAPAMSETILGIINFTGSLEYTVSITAMIPEVHQINEKYIPDSIARTQSPDLIIVNNNAYNGSILPSMLSIKAGSVETVMMKIENGEYPVVLLDGTFEEGGEIFGDITRATHVRKDTATKISMLFNNGRMYSIALDTSDGSVGVACAKLSYEEITG